MSQSERTMDKEEFLAAIKLVSGEEILSMVTSVHDDNGDYLDGNLNGWKLILPSLPFSWAHLGHR